MKLIQTVVTVVFLSASIIIAFRVGTEESPPPSSLLQQSPGSSEGGSLAAKASSSEGDARLVAEVRRPLRGFERAQHIEQQLRQARMDDAARAQRIAARFLSQRRDPLWAEAAETQVVTALSDPSMAEFSGSGSVTDVDCRKEVCRIRARFTGGGEAIDWAGPLMMGLSGSLPGAFMQRTPLINGGVEVDLYLASNDGMPLIQS